MASLQQGSSGGGNSNRILAVGQTPPAAGDWAAGGTKEFDQEDQVYIIQLSFPLSPPFIYLHILLYIPS